MARRGLSPSTTNTAWSYVLQAANLASSLAVIPLLSRALGAETFGIYAFAFNILNYLAVVTAYGFQLWGSREVARRQHPDDRGQIFYRVLYAKAILLAVVAIPWSLLAFGLFDGATGESIGWFGLALLGLTFNSAWLFIGAQGVKAPALAALAARFLVVALAFILVREPADIFLYCGIYGLGCLLESSVQMVQARKFITTKPIKFRAADIAGLLRESFPLFLSSALGVFLAGAGVLVLGLVSTPSELGGFAGVMRVVQFVVVLFVPLSNALYPRSCVVPAEESARRTMSLTTRIVPIFIVISIGLSAASDWLISAFLGSDFLPYSPVVAPLAGWTVLAILANITGIHGLVAQGRQQSYLGIIAISTFSTYLLTFVWGKSHGAIGAAYGVLVGEAIGVALIVASITWRQRRFA
ncbi:oligosaccharide flippase family protein [Dietzia maris]|uniref:oligosaccharide flippase family protein n=1 Tax=Dietzia maris TaxID=37915 RepID=UPI0021AECDC2|nr:oligosaccharide flippase family protein [Dietzia maris]MCT1434817.1 oligosaccharide flippase family protein [Dietzia maris]MCT1522772.1 oligosaccharide flippase family protein [Dietzia maris]